MNWLFNSLTKKYDAGDKEEILKVNFIVLITISVISITLVTIVTSVFFHHLNITIGIQGAAAMVMLLGLVTLARGNCSLAVHIILAAGFVSLWIVLFLDPSHSLLAKLDSFVLVIGLSSAMSIAFFKNRRPIVAYFIINSLLFVAFNYHLRLIGGLTLDEQLEYFFDNAVAMVFVFLVSFSAFKIHQEALTGLRQELAERKKAENALFESKNILSHHLTNTPVGAIFWDLDFRVTDWNPAAESIFGYTKKEALGKIGDVLIFPEELKAPVKKHFEDLTAERGGIRSVSENITRTGKRILCDWYNTTLKNTRGELIGAASLVNDITEQTRIQEFLIQSEKMMSVGGLAAGMAHELNNPLSGMMQYAQVARNRLTMDAPANTRTAEDLGISMQVIRSYAEQRGVVQQLINISEAGQRAAKIIDNMLSFSRKSDTCRQKLDLEELIERTIDLAGHDYDLKKKYNFKRIEIIRDFDPSIPAVHGERSKIQQVLFNLFKNATDAMNMKTYDDGGPKLTLRLKMGQNHVHLLVEDNGAGIPPETCRHIFEPFFTTKKEKGTGLGLSISHAIITDDHGGRMTVESTLGKGTQFTIKLPLRQKAHGSEPSAY